MPQQRRAGLPLLAPAGRVRVVPRLLAERRFQVAAGLQIQPGKVQLVPAVAAEDRLRVFPVERLQLRLFLEDDAQQQRRFLRVRITALKRSIGPSAWAIIESGQLKC